MALIHRILVIFGLGFCVVWSLICTLPLIIFRPVANLIGPFIQRGWGLGCLAFMGVRVTTLHENRIPQVGVVIAPNHESMFDILVMASQKKNFRWISKKEVGRIPFIGAAMRSLGAYFLKRDRSGSDMNVMKLVEKGLRQGHSVVIFPEGTRSVDGNLLPLKKGAFRTAQNGGVRVLPVGLAGTMGIASKGKWPSVWGHKVVVNYGEPFTIGPTEELQVAIARFHETLLALILEARRHL
ncbi:MAG: 1-acyl-sn-glycerol-3-phosphate acyltransferase [Deltaproteobacteria bacterium]|nr:1-acyl-sn-glycerol-3-phosphate acyltransferase [Deltaproteobacteria bacterium]MBI3296432.1 1-acyl-sn-glycerol-3-phosphate acyltransferase [Deltaproteobacteria bacterium]